MWASASKPVLWGRESFVSRWRLSREGQEKGGRLRRSSCDVPPGADSQTWQAAWRDGMYGAALQRFADSVGVESVEAVFTSDLEQEPAHAVGRLAARAGIDTAAVDHFDFTPRNVGWDARWPRVNAIATRGARITREALREHPQIRALARRWKGRRPVRAANLAGGPAVTDALPEWLMSRYRGDAAVLARIAGRAVPWFAAVAGR